MTRSDRGGCPTTVLSYVLLPPRPAFEPVAAVKETELWQRLDQHLGVGYHRVWAAEFNLADLDNRTVVQALADGLPTKAIWRAVWMALDLPARER